MSKKSNMRIKHKIETDENWALAINFVPLKGEICIYSTSNKIKIGDGQTLIKDLPFATVSPSEIEAISDMAIKELS